MTYAVLFLAWLIGAAGSNAALSHMGTTNPNTFGDSFSGDDMLDLICIMAWPLFWPCWAAHKLVQYVLRS